jgi:hypothetical protein
MTANVPFTRIATFHARAGQADRLVERLLHAVGLVAEAAGCEEIEVLAFGLHSPGDGEMVTDWSAP